VGEGAAAVRTVVVGRMVEPRLPLIGVEVLVVMIRVVIMVADAVTMIVVVVVSVPVFQEDDGAVDVDVVVAVVRGVQPREDRQRAAECAEYEAGDLSPATHFPPGRGV